MSNLQHWRSRACIKKSALLSNVANIRKRAKDKRIMAVVKADAYGHGLENIFRILQDHVDAFAVATIAEGVRCREICADKIIVVLSEYWRAEQLLAFSQYDLQPAIHCQQQIDWLQSYEGKPISVWLKIDTGMHRLGFDYEVALDKYRCLRELNSIRDVRVMSHLANADNPSDDFSRLQIERFKNTIEQFDTEFSMANSAGVMMWPDSHFQWLRPGLLLYGASPLQSIPADAVDNPKDLKNPENPKNVMQLTPVMTLQARVISKKTIESGESVGYGRAYTATKEMQLAVVGYGYGDGYPRNISSQAYVLINGHKAPIVGKVSMDMMSVDISHLQDVELGDKVTLWGEELPVTEVAKWASVLPYELLCKVTPRTIRVVM